MHFCVGPQARSRSAIFTTGCIRSWHSSFFFMNKRAHVSAKSLTCGFASRWFTGQCNLVSLIAALFSTHADMQIFSNLIFPQRLQHKHMGHTWGLVPHYKSNIINCQSSEGSRNLKECSRRCTMMSQYTVTFMKRYLQGVRSFQRSSRRQFFLLSIDYIFQQH